MREQRTCTEDGCDRPHLARGWCSKHYWSWQRSRPEYLAKEREYDRKRRKTPERQEQERRREATPGRRAYQQAWSDARRDWGAWWERQRRIEDRRDLRSWRPKVWPACRVSQRPRTRRFTAFYCAGCGVGFVDYTARESSVYCEPCNDKRWRADGRHKRRAWKAAATIRDVISPEEVFRRDGYRCQLCGERTKGTFPALDAPTVDHIVPLAVGGEHSYSNVQCACFGCNSRKGAGAANDQLRLAVAV